MELDQLRQRLRHHQRRPENPDPQASANLPSATSPPALSARRRRTGRSRNAAVATNVDHFTHKLNYDFTGPEKEGLSRAERRQILEAA